MLCLSGFELYSRWVPLFRMKTPLFFVFVLPKKKKTSEYPSMLVSCTSTPHKNINYVTKG